MIHSFHGGVHPQYKKAPHPVVEIAQPHEVIIPLAQHIGAPCEPLVQVGDTVTMGQKIGEARAPVSAPVHASVSGRVIAVEPRPHPLGNFVLSIVIENDFRDTPCQDLAPLTEEELQDPEAILARIREAGIVGMGGAAFPTAFKLQSGRGKVDTLIINGAECEPYLNGDHLTMLNHPEELLKGIRLAARAAGVKRVCYGIEINKLDGIHALRAAGAKDYGIEIMPEKVKYPQGAEKMQVFATTGRKVPTGGLPAAVGCCLISTRTAYAIYKACYEGMPCVERIVTVAGSAVAGTVNALTRVGTPLSFLVQKCGGFVKEPQKVVLGGPLMGICVSRLDCPTIKGIAGVLFFTREEDKTAEDPNCIRCGRCVNACPMKLQPIFMYMHFRKGNYAEMDKYHVRDCFECGSCSWVCPARLPLTHAFRTTKQILWEQDQARKEANAK